MSSRISRLATAARVYIKNGPTVHLTAKTGDTVAGNTPKAVVYASAAERVADLAREVYLSLVHNHPLDAMTTDGDRIQIPSGEIVDVVYPQEQETQVAVPAQVFWGKAIHVRAFKAWLAENPDAANGCSFAEGSDLDQYTVVIGEDLAQAEIVVVNVATGHVAWANPACPQEAITKAVAAAMLLGEAEELTNIAYNEHQTPLEDQDLRVADIENATAHMERGDVQAALNIAGPAFVAAFLDESALPPEKVCVGTRTADVLSTAYGVITGYDADNKEFQITRFDHGDAVRRRVEFIDEVVSYEWAEYQRTGNPETLTEYGRRVVDQLPVPDVV